MEKTFTIPADIAVHCIKAAFVLASSERMLRRELEIWNDPADPDWYASLPHAEVKTCADNLAGAHEFLHWLGQFAEDAKPELVAMDSEGGAA